MRLLFDTHAFIWWDSQPEKLSKRVLALCQDPENALFLSVVSLWEMQIKTQLGKLDLTLPLEDIVSQQVEENNVQLLPVIAPHVFELESIGSHHRDPFDRLLIAQ